MVHIAFGLARRLVLRLWVVSLVGSPILNSNHSPSMFGFGVLQPGRDLKLMVGFGFAPHAGEGQAKI